jgi:hypothetical protein
MDKRLEITDDTLLKAIEQVTIAVARRVAEKGRQSFTSPHETLGIITEEYYELNKSVTHEDPIEIGNELTDIAVGCVYGLASMLQYEDELKAARQTLEKNISSSESAE